MTMFRDREQDKPVGYCRKCGGEIYEAELLEENGGLCSDCAKESDDAEQPEWVGPSAELLLKPARKKRRAGKK